MTLGLTATRKGLTPAQTNQLSELMVAWKPSEAHHGDCVGGDEQFHNLCVSMGIPVVIHPPEDSKLRAFCTGALRTEAPKPYLARNKDIVHAVTCLVGCPKEPREPASKRGGGTWSTIRYARRTGAALLLISPNGALYRNYSTLNPPEVPR